MGTDKAFYITTPIYYVNGDPHIGHAYTTTAADAISRYQRQKGHRVVFLTGTDEHGQKVLEAAEKRGMSPQAHCDDMVVRWKRMMSELDIRFDRFIRTTDADHVAVVQGALQRLHAAGELYLDRYTGWYSTAAERFWTEKELIDGRCPESGLPVVEITEENWFFRMGKYKDALLAHLEAHPEYVQPASRRNEVIGFLQKDLGDLCISRPKARMPWGIEIPFAPDFVTYVWFDALLNYLTGAGYRPDGDGDWAAAWPADFQLLGKDILTTHAVYWSTMLMALGVPLPRTLFAHGWWTSAEGAKMSKSLGNAIDVGLLRQGYGLDATRYFLLREIAFGADGRFTYDGFLARYNSDLANDFGNLAHRGLSMTEKWLGGRVPARGPELGPDAALRALAARTVNDVDRHLEELAFHKALESVNELVRAGNKYVDETAPWALNKAGDTARLSSVLRNVLELLAVAGALQGFAMPERCGTLLSRLGLSDLDAALRRLHAGGLPLAELGFDLLTPGAALTVGDPLFPRFAEQPENIATLFAEPAPAPAPPPPEEKPVSEIPAEPASELIEYDHFAKVKLRAATVVAAEKHPNADRLLVLTVDAGEPEPRTIVAGIASKFAPEELVGRRVVIVANLKPAKLRGVMSHGMLLAAGGGEVIDLVGVDAPPGAIVR